MRLPRYPAYKTSGREWLGHVPAHWKVMPIRLAARLESGHTPSRSRPDWWEDCTVPWFTLADVSQIRQGGLDVIFDTKEKVSELGLLNSSARRLPPGTVMLSRTASVGFTAIMGVEMATTQDFANWVCGPSLRPRFLLQVFRAMQSEFARLMMGSTHNTIYMPDIASLRFALPPLEEQDSIVEFVAHETAKIDALIAEQEKLIALLAEKRQATISDAVTRGLDPAVPLMECRLEWLDQVPAHWSLPPLYLRYDIELGKMLDAGRITGKHLVRYLRNVDVQWDSINLDDLPTMDIEPREYERYTVSDGDVLVCEGGEVGRAAVAQVGNEPIGFQKALHRLRARSHEEWPRYLYYTFAWAAKVGAFSGEGQSTIAHLTGKQLRRYRFPRPPLGEQISIARHLDTEMTKLDRLGKEIRSQLNLLRERRSALITAAVTGQIDVRGAVAA